MIFRKSEAYKELLRKFLEDLKLEKKKGEQLFKTLSEGKLSQESKKSLSVFSHRLTGSAGTYGFMDISEKASFLEKALSEEKSMSDIQKALCQLLEALSKAKSK